MYVDNLAKCLVVVGYSIICCWLLYHRYPIDKSAVFPFARDVFCVIINDSKGLLQLTSKSDFIRSINDFNLMTFPKHKTQRIMGSP